MFDSPCRPVPRRTVLAVTAAVAMAPLAGCELDLDPPDDAAPSDGPDAILSDEEFDTDLAGKAARSISATLAEVRAAAERHVGLAQSLAGLIAMHEAHHALLADSGADSDDGGDPSGSPSESVTAPPVSGQALSRLTASERKLGRDLEGWAVGARSGQFARVLASMSASVSQHVAALPAAKEPAA